jgi:hypothetical protein
MALTSGGQVGESPMRRICRISNGYSSRHLAPPLVHHNRLTHGSVAQKASRWGRPTWGSMPIFIQVTTRWVLWCVWGDCSVSSQLSHGCGPMDLRACSWLVKSVLLWIEDVSWPRGLLCDSTSPCALVWVPPGPHDIFCISLSSELQSKRMIYPF